MPLDAIPHALHAGLGTLAAWLPLATDEGGGAGGADGLGGFLMPLLIVGFIFYFLVFRPASKERKAREAQVQAIKKHDKVVTNAGIHGTVVSMDEETVTLEVDKKSSTRIRFARAAIWQVEPKGGGKETAGAAAS